MRELFIKFGDKKIFLKIRHRTLQSKIDIAVMSTFFVYSSIVTTLNYECFKIFYNVFLAIGRQCKYTGSLLQPELYYKLEYDMNRRIHDNSQRQYDKI